MKRLQEETMCKMAVLGRGSMKDRKKVRTKFSVFSSFPICHFEFFMTKLFLFFDAIHVVVVDSFVSFHKTVGRRVTCITRS